ncbi:MAG: URC4/urg3 family protein [Caulobacteraceae bacterium]|nr:URC4/urg3 family protein [Caulobacteraceae bacterium]
MTSSEDGKAARALLCAAAVREHAHAMLALGEAGELEHWSVHLDRLPAAAAFVAEVVQEQYPTLEVPFHARWRHFVSGGRDLWAEAMATYYWPDAAARARAAFDLAITSVLLDAGAGPGWTFEDPGTGLVSARSEGLAVASFRMFEGGAFSADPKDPFRADASVLSALTADDLAAGFQVSDANPLVGLEGRAALLRRLGDQCADRPALFALEDSARPGGLYDGLARRCHPGALAAPMILDAVLEGLGPIWQGRPVVDGVALGDCWPHPTAGLTPLHKLSQWLSYSLVEPLQAAGIEVIDLDGLTGLAEYRNGGLFMDMGVLQLRDPANAARAWPVEHPLVVEWRAMTVALLDRIAPLVREALEVEAGDMPLASVLEGGTWAAGRRIAALRREGGGPPLAILSDGTVF